ncbi:hypothetical protein C1645_875022 [Glomus cerebriforme]|uniref:Uncharacterized protein n=1 Tax=Glomus cerebriforme TaxID=658196 RepID=A0A397TAU0_9GLOM|nr:hypothetical protein C1645_875022 [Glomus cerebriforme]
MGIKGLAKSSNEARMFLESQFEVVGEKATGQVDFAIKKIIDSLNEELVCITKEKQNQEVLDFRDGTWMTERTVPEQTKGEKPDERTKLNERNLNKRTKRKPDEQMKPNEWNLNKRTKRKSDERMKPNEWNLNERTKKLDEWIKPNDWDLGRTKLDEQMKLNEQNLNERTKRKPNEQLDSDQFSFRFESVLVRSTTSD